MRVFGVEVRVRLIFLLSVMMGMVFWERRSFEHGIWHFCCLCMRVG